MDFAVAISPEMIDGLTVGFGMGETEAVTGTVIDDQTMYATYAYGSLTVGYQVGESDGAASSSDIDFTGMGASYAITDDISVSYNTSTIDLASSANDQEASAIAASYTSGGITVKGTMHSIDNVGHTATSDLDGYEFNIGFAF